MIITNTIPGRTFSIASGTEWLNFAGTAYLGMPHYKPYQKAIQLGIEKYGANYGSSRASAPQIDLYSAMEEKLAQAIGAPAAALVSSGTLAGQLTVRFFETSHDCYFAPDAHPAITLKDSQVTDQPFSDWLTHTVTQINSKEHPAAIFCNAIDPLGVQQYDFSELQLIEYPSRVTLVIDDSHALGITHQGLGSYRHLRQTFPELKLLVTASTGKAWGLPAGMLLGEAELIAHIRQRAFFRGASPPLPAYLYAFDEVFPNLPQLWSQLMKNINYFHHRLGQHSSIQTLANYPVTSVSIAGLDEIAAKKNILISAFPYPAPDSPKLIRMVINALHTQHDLDHLLHLIKENL